MKKTCLLLVLTYFFSSSVFSEETDTDQTVITSESTEAEQEPLGLQQVKKGPLADFAEALIENGRLHFMKLYDDTVEAPSALKLVMDILNQNYKDLAFNIWAEYTPSAITRWAFSGLSRMLTSKKDYDEERMEYLSRIITVSWWLHGIASEKRRFYDSNSFTIIDPDYKLYEFLLAYVKLVTGTDNPAGWTYFSNVKNNYAYRRDPNASVIPGSSHHKRFMGESQFGIDIRFRSSQTILALLPMEGNDSKAHILFGKLTIPGSELPLLFVKFEEVGLGGVGEAILHTRNLLLPHEKKTALNATREKDIHPRISSAYKDITGEDAPKGKAVFEMLIDLHENERFQEFADSVRSVYPSDPLDAMTSRIGNEIIVDLRPFAYTIPE